MKKVYYNKLIRDKIPAKMERLSVQFETRTLPTGEFATELLKKVEEEASALVHAKTQKELVEELADVQDVIDEIKKVKKISTVEMERAQEMNKEKKGGFKKRLFLLWSEDNGYKTNEKRR